MVEAITKEEREAIRRWTENEDEPLILPRFAVTSKFPNPWRIMDAYEAALSAAQARIAELEKPDPLAEELASVLKRCISEITAALNDHFDSNAIGATWRDGDPYDLELITDMQEYAEAERMLGTLTDAKRALAAYQEKRK